MSFLKEHELQGALRDAVDSSTLLSQIVGWEKAEGVAAAASAPDFDPFLTLDDIVRYRVARAALLVRERLHDLVVMADNRVSISLDSAQRLFADLIGLSPSSGAVVLFEIKRSRVAARETATELLAYEHEIRNQLPFIGRSEVNLVVVSSDFSPLLDHAVTSLVAWHHLQVLCLRVDDNGGYVVHLPTAWTTFGQWRIDSRAVEVMDLSFSPDRMQGDLGVEECSALLSTALDLIRREGERDGTTGFAFVWSDVLYPRLTSAPCSMTIARVSPLVSARDARIDAFLGDATTPLRHFITGSFAEDCPPMHVEVESAQRFLSAFGQVALGGLTTWDRLRSDTRHRSDGFIMDRRAQPLEFALWGALADYGADLFANPSRLAAFYAGHLKPGISLSNPMLAMRLVDKVIIDDNPPWLGAQWFSSLGFRLSRLRTHRRAWPGEDQPNLRRQLLPLLTWAAFDVAAMASDLEAAAQVIGSREGPPALSLGSTEAVWDSSATISSLEALAEWVHTALIGADQPVMRAMFDIAYQHGWLLDRYIEAMAPEGSLTQAIDELGELGRERISKLLRVTQETPDKFAPLVELAAETFENFDVARPLDAVKALPAEMLMEEFVTGIPRLHDLLIEPLGLRLPLAVPHSVDWDGIQQKLVELLGRGVAAVVEIDPSGGVGIDVLDEPPVVRIDPTRETWVLVRQGLVSVMLRETWDDLRSGNVDWARISSQDL